MKTIPHPWSPYIIGLTQFPNESDPEYFVKSPNGQIVAYAFTYEIAVHMAIDMKEKDDLLHE